MTDRSKHILVIRLSAMGDVAMVVPILKNLTTTYPHLKITVLTKSFFKPIFRDIPNVQVYEAKIHGQHKGIFGLLKLSSELKRLNIDCVADLHNVVRSQLVSIFLALPTKRINKGRAEKKRLINGHIFEQLKTTHQRYADVFSELGFPIDLNEKNNLKNRALSPSLAKGICYGKSKIIGIAPFAAHKGKMYPLDQMKQIIADLSKDHQIVLFGGGPTESKQLEQLEKEFSQTVSLSGKVSFSEELDIISNLDLMISMDSGNGHLAAMYGVKVITIWGVTHPYAGFAPYHQPEDLSLLADRMAFPKIPTSIYGNKCPKEYEKAAASVSPQSVILKARSVLYTSS